MRTRWTLTMAAAVALGLLSARAMMAQDGPPDRPPPRSGDRVEQGAPPDGPRDGQEPRRADDRRAPGPPRDGDDNRPPRDGRPGMDGQRMPGPPRDGDDNRPPRDGRPGMDSQRMPGPPREGDDNRPPRDGRPGMDGQRMPGPPREGDDNRPPRDGRPGMDGQRMPGPPREGDDNRPPRWPHDDWGAMEKSDPEMFKLVRQDMELDRQTHETVADYRKAPTDQRDKIKKQIQELASKQFDVRQERRNLDLKRLDGELQRLREAIERRNKARDQIIEKRVAELLGTDVDTGF